MLHLQLKQEIEQHLAAHLEKPLELCLDALLVHLNNGVVLELRCQSNEEYSLGWSWGDVQLRIDTAPLHPQLATFPNHLHDADGSLRADVLTHPGADCWDNVRTLLLHLLQDPLMVEISAA